MFKMIIINITGKIHIILRDINLPSLENFKQHSQRIWEVDYNIEFAAADDIVSSMKKNYLVFPANPGYVYKLYHTCDRDSILVINESMVLTS